MTEKQNKIKEIVENAICKFNQNEYYLIENNLSERCICSQFARYLTLELAGTEFSEYKVDVEYNRGMYGKAFATKVINGHNAVVDLIVHKRGWDEEYGFDNLICIEMKKSSKERFLRKDKGRLFYMTHSNFNYRMGFMIIAEKGELTINQCFHRDYDF